MVNSADILNARILIVDDKEVNILLPESMLRGAGRIHVTDSTRSELGVPFLLEERGVIDVKGKGERHAWFLNGRNP